VVSIANGDLLLRPSGGTSRLTAGRFRSPRRLAVAKWFGLRSLWSNSRMRVREYQHHRAAPVAACNKSFLRAIAANAGPMRAIAMILRGGRALWSACSRPRRTREAFSLQAPPRRVSPRPHATGRVDRAAGNQLQHPCKTAVSKLPVSIATPAILAKFGAGAACAQGRTRREFRARREHRKTRWPGQAESPG
jgi:hypothetical protein